MAISKIKVGDTEHELNAKYDSNGKQISTTYLPLAGGTMNDGATLKFSTYGNRFVTISGNSISADMSKETGGWEGAFASVKDPSNTTTTMLGWYGNASGLTHIFMGGTYSDPAMKMTPAGQFTFKNRPKVGTSYVALKSEIPTVPTLATVATSGSYNDLTNKPTIPTDTNTTYDLGASKSSTNGNVKLNLTAGGSGRGTDSVTIKGTGGTTVTTDANGVVTINSSATTSSSVTVDSALSSTSTNPVQNKVVNAALNNKLTANGWSTNSTGALVYGANDSKQIQIRRDYIYLMNDSEQTETTLRFPTGNKNSTIATIEDIQSYIDTAILGGSW